MFRYVQLAEDTRSLYESIKQSFFCWHSWAFMYKNVKYCNLEIKIFGKLFACKVEWETMTAPSSFEFLIKCLCSLHHSLPFQKGRLWLETTYWCIILYLVCKKFAEKSLFLNTDKQVYIICDGTTVFRDKNLGLILLRHKCFQPSVHSAAHVHSL